MNNNQDNNYDDVDDDHPLFPMMLQQLRQMARAEGYAEHDVIDMPKIRNILEITGHDVPLAAQLYFDDFLATQARAGVAAPPLAEPHAAAQPEAAAGGEVGDADAETPIRRRLEGEFNLHAAVFAQLEGEEQGAEPERAQDNDAHVREGVARIVAQARETARLFERRLDRGILQADEGAEEDAAAAADDDDDEHNANVAGLAARAAEAFLAARGGGETVSVSDDESGGVWKMVGGIAARLDEEGLAPDADYSDTPKRKRRKTDEHNGDKKKADNASDDGYLSDNDWLWESLGSRTSIPLCTPCDWLWGLPPSSTASRSEAAPDPAVEAAVDAAAVEGNVIADDEGDEESTCERSGIPRQWVNASFSISEDGAGLVLEPPSEDDIGLFAGQQLEADGNLRNTPPPPFHCASISAVISIVTGLMYTGASFQTKSTSFTSSRKPFVELTDAERKREFESRLADALAALLHIAAKTSRARKEAALNVLKRSKDPADKRKWQKLESKLLLCPTCWWETDSTGEVLYPQGRDLDRKLQVSTSYTNIEDLRAYVLSNMRSFMARGGCALFLETILRIHGKGAVMRMVERSKRAANLPTTERSLVQCTCEERSKRQKIKLKQLQQRSKTKEFMEALSAGGNECMSIELISLLLTGKVHSTWKGWSTGPLGLGILSSKASQVSRGLARPEKPVWILCGPSLYSVIWLNQGYDLPENFAKADQPSSVAVLTHFSPWPGKRHKTTLRLSADRSKWAAPIVSKPHAVSQPPTGYSTMAELLLLRRKEAMCVSSDELDEVDSVDPELLVTNEQLDSVLAKLDDQKFYPEQYRLWRYSFADDGNEDEDKKVHAREWIPFHRLNDRQKLLVETKLGPKISTILWTRWPRAMIDAFDPKGPPPLV